jgi:hypothetical protein
LLAGKNLYSGAQTRKLFGSAMFRALIDSKAAVRLPCLIVIPAKAGIHFSHLPYC